MERMEPRSVYADAGSGLIFAQLLDYRNNFGLACCESGAISTS